MNTPPLTAAVHQNFAIQDLQSFIDSNFADQAQPYRSETFCLVWVQKGKGIYEVDVHRYPLCDNTVYCIYPGKVFFFHHPVNIKGYVITFSAEFLCPYKEGLSAIINGGLFRLYDIRPVAIAPEARPGLEVWLHSLAEEYLDQANSNAEMLRALLRLLVIQLGRVCQSIEEQQEAPDSDHHDIEFVNNFFELVQTNFITMKKVSDYARLLKIAPNYLNVKVKRVSGFTARHHIQQCILLEAKRQAKWEGMSLKQTAYLLGFDDIAHFSKFFKRTAGMSYSYYKRTPA